MSERLRMDWFQRIVFCGRITSFENDCVCVCARARGCTVLVLQMKTTLNGDK